MFPAYYIFNALLSTLLILHVVWTYFILKIVYKGIYTGKVSSFTHAVQQLDRYKLSDEVIKEICYDILY